MIVRLPWARYIWIGMVPVVDFYGADICQIVRSKYERVVVSVYIIQSNTIVYYFVFWAIFWIVFFQLSRSGSLASSSRKTGR